MRTEFTTTSRRINRQALPMRLFEKAKTLGIWNPSDINLNTDQLDWQKRTPIEQQVILHLSSLFQSGEEAVTNDILPLISLVASEERLEEEIYLTSFLFEEAKHTEFFDRFLSEVCQPIPDLDQFHSDNYRTIFYNELPQALTNLRFDTSARAQIRAAVTYNLVVEGMLAETGYHAFFTMLQRNNIFPGLQKGIYLLKQDESRHIAYGIYFLSRHIAAAPELWEAIEQDMNRLFLPAVGVINDIFQAYDPMPFGLVEDDFVNYAIDQFNKRYERIEKAKQQTLPEIEQTDFLQEA